MISGTPENANAWKAAFPDSEKSRYWTTVHDRDTRLEWLMKHFNDPPRVAILTETETHLEANGGQVRTFLYPREISRLRNAYGDEALKTVVGAQQQPASFRNLLGFRLYDVGFGTDSTPLLATNQTPLSQDSVLLEIGRSLQRERIEMAGILATDVYDALFIARYLRDTCPDVRIFTFDPDLLYERAAEDFSMDGILALGTYPLISSNKAWTDPPTPGPPRPDPPTPLTVFPSQRAEGIYNATRALLIGNSFVSSCYQDEPLAEYSAPNHDTTPGASQPPIWLLAVTRTGFWPLAVKETANGRPLLNWPSKAKGAKLSIGPLPRLWKLLFVIVSVAISGYFVQQFRVVHIQDVGEGWLARLCYFQVCSLTLLALYALLVAPLLAASAAGFGTDARWPVNMAWLLLCLFGTMTAGSLFAFVLGWAVVQAVKQCCKPTPNSGASDFPKWPESWNLGILGLAWILAGIFVWALIALFVLPLYSAADDYKDQVGLFFAFRSLHISSGVSPLAPLLVLVLAYFLWGFVHLKRVRLLQERLIDVPAVHGDLRNETGEAAALESTRQAIDFRVKEPLALSPWLRQTVKRQGTV